MAWGKGSYFSQRVDPKLDGQIESWPKGCRRADQITFHRNNVTQLPGVRVSTLAPGIPYLYNKDNEYSMKQFFFSQRFLYICLLLFVFLIHSTYLPNGFTWLDQRDIVEGHAVLPLSKLPEAFLTRYGDTGFYRPVVTITNSLDAALYKQYAPGYHFTNVFIFVAIVAVVPFFLQAFFAVSFGEALVAALIISVHPFGFLPVGSISYRPELLFTLFSLLTTLFYIKTRQPENQSTRQPMRLSALCFFSLALLSKETTLFLVPAAIGVWNLSQHLLLRESMTKQSHKKFIPFTAKRGVFFTEIASFFAMTIVYIFLRLYAVPELWRVSVSFPSASEALGTRLYILGSLLIRFFSPFLPSISDATPIVGITNPSVVTSLLGLFLLLVTLSRIGIKNSFGRALGLFLVFLAPAVSIIPVPRMASPHYGFIALIPFSLLLVLFIKKYRSSRLPSVARTIMFFWIIIASVVTFSNGYRFQTDETLFLSDVTNDANFHEGQFYLGNYYLQQRDFSQAESFYLAALQKNTTVIAYVESFSVLINLSAVYYAQGKVDDADKTLQRAQKVAPKSELSHIFYNRAVIASNRKDWKSVIIFLDRKEFQTNPYALFLLANALHYSGKDTEAIAILQHSLPYWKTADERKHVEELIQGTRE
jgi:tetratricopeptide (TPR) repeat protein